MWKCKHCEEKFEFQTTSEKANHARWCDANPSPRETARMKEARRTRVDRELGHETTLTVTCEMCPREFSVTGRVKHIEKKQKFYCSRACANSVGGTSKARKHHPDTEAHYRTVCRRYHMMRCIICDEENIVSIHHIDGNHDNNEPSNLVPLCPTHHQYCHSRFAYLIHDRIREYRQKFMTSRAGNVNGNMHAWHA